MRSLINFHARSILTILILPFVLANAQNAFIFPTGASGQSFQDGTTLDVTWTSNFTEPILRLYCSYIESPFVNTPIPSGSEEYTLKLAFGPQPNCYLLLSQGADQFGTGIFAITAANGAASNATGTTSAGIAPSGTSCPGGLPSGTASYGSVPTGSVCNGTASNGTFYKRRLTQRASRSRMLER